MSYKQPQDIMNNNKKMALLPSYYRALGLGVHRVETSAGNVLLLVEEEEEEEYVDPVCAKALRINCIVRHIMQYLPHSSLKRCRLVCKTWNGEACRILRRKSKIVLNNSLKLAEFYWGRLSPKSPLFENFQLVNVHVSTPLMELFFQNFGSQTKHLDLRDSKWTTEDVERILTQVMPNLEELAIHGVIPRDARLFQIKKKEEQAANNDNRSSNQIIVSNRNNVNGGEQGKVSFLNNGTKVPKIKQVDLQLHDKSIEELPLQLFLSDLLSTFPNLEKISSKETIRKGDGMKMKSRRGKFHRILFDTLIKPEGKDNPIILRYLSQIDFSLTPWNDDQIQQLAAKKFPLTALSIDVLPCVSIQALLMLLNTYKRTLVKLKISFASWRIADFPPGRLQLGNLHHLSLDWFNGSLNFLSNLPELKTVILAQVNVNEAFLQVDTSRFVHGHRLRTFEAYQLAEACILPVTVQIIAKVFPDLRKLVMGKLTDESMREVFKCMTTVEDFSAIEGNFSDEGVTGIPMFSCRICGKQHLVELCRGVYNEALVSSQRTHPSVASLPNLWRLELRSARMTNLSVFHGVLMVKHLRSLSLWSCDLTFRSLKKLVDDKALDYLETTHSFIHRAEIYYALKRIKAGKFILNGHQAPKNPKRGSVECNLFLSQFYPMEVKRGCRSSYIVCPEQQALQNLAYL